MNKHCFQIVIRLENKMTMPGFATELKDSEGSISTTLYMIEKQSYYPIRMIGVNYSAENPEQKFFIDQTYYDIKYNIEIDENIQFDTSDESLAGNQIDEIKP